MKIIVGEIEQTEYCREIECIGNKLVFFKVHSAVRYIGQKYHYFFVTNCKTMEARKPPLDIAIHPETGSIDYISFFAKNENLHRNRNNRIIREVNKHVIVQDSRFNYDHYQIDEERIIDLTFSKNSVSAIDRDSTGIITSYIINNENKILFDEKSNFVGVELSNITMVELAEMKKGNIL